MNRRQTYALTALLSFFLSAALLIYGLFFLGLLKKNTIVVSTLATTGPDFEVSCGQLKLQMQMSDSVDNIDVGGVMVTGKSITSIDNYLNSYMAFDDYFILTGEIVGLKRSDGTSFHPLINVTAWGHIDKLLFWTLLIVDIGLLLLFGLFYRKYKQAATQVFI